MLERRGRGGGCFADHCDWRIPSSGVRSIAELEGILSFAQGACGGGSGACISPVFGPTADDLYWSNTTLFDTCGPGATCATPTITKAAAVDFSGGPPIAGEKSSALPARAVRGP